VTDLQVSLYDSLRFWLGLRPSMAMVVSFFLAPLSARFSLMIVREVSLQIS